MHGKMRGAGFIYKFLTVPNFVLKFIKNEINYTVGKMMTSSFT